MLASYTSADFGLRFASLSELEHVQYVLNAMIEIHDEVVREHYTGRYFRKCWALDPLVSASWASLSIGMHKLYIPTFFETHNNVISCRKNLDADETDGMQMIFVGEHTRSVDSFQSRCRSLLMVLSYIYAWSESQILGRNLLYVLLMDCQYPLLWNQGS